MFRAVFHLARTHEGYGGDTVGVAAGECLCLLPLPLPEVREHDAGPLAVSLTMRRAVSMEFVIAIFASTSPSTNCSTGSAPNATALRACAIGLWVYWLLMSASSLHFLSGRLAAVFNTCLEDL